MAFSRLLLKTLALAGFLATASAADYNSGVVAPYDVPTTTEPCPSMPPTKSDSSTCKTLQNKDRPGYDFKNVTAGVASCDGLCKGEKTCKTWAWSQHAGGTCWLKNFVAPLVDLAGVVTTECTFHDNAPGPSPSPTCAFEDGVDLTGEDIGNKPAASASLCCDICKSFDKCKAWSWSGYNSGTCWLKKNFGQKIPKAGVVSAVSGKGDDNKDTCKFEYDVDFEANDIGNKPAKDAGECCSLCKANTNCKAYTWTDYQYGTCWMKSAKGKTIAKAGAVSAKLT